MNDARRLARWRFLVSPRWLCWHLGMLACVAGMAALGYWQYTRAAAGNALSWAYTFEWPLFAGFAVVFWAKTIKDEFSPPAADGASAGPELPAGAVRAAGPGGPAAGDEADEDDRELAAYNAYLARLHQQAQGHGK